MKSILLVDNDEQILNLLSFYLRPFFLNILKMKTADEAINFLNGGNMTDLIIFEIALPNESGWEGFNEIRRRTDVPIIILTSKIRKTDIVLGLRSGADDYITKPFNDKELLARIEAVLRRNKKNVSTIKKC